MLQCSEFNREIPQERILRDWVKREEQKEIYPDATFDEWGRSRLVSELEQTYDEPAEAAVRESPSWASIEVSGHEVGKFDAFPACGWDKISNNGTISDVIDNLQSEQAQSEFLTATKKISKFKRLLPNNNLGAIVARQFNKEWPPVILEGNHRACAAHWLAREEVSVQLRVHLGYNLSVENLPIDTG